MDITEIEKSKSIILVEIIEYMPNSMITKNIIRKTTGNICIVAIDKGKTFAGKVSPFDSFIQIVEGNAEIIIDEKSNTLKTGSAIIIPAHSSSLINAKERFKMILTIIKSGYEENFL